MLEDSLFCYPPEFQCLFQRGAVPFNMRLDGGRDVPIKSTLRHTSTVNACEHERCRSGINVYRFGHLAASLTNVAVNAMCLMSLVSFHDLIVFFGDFSNAFHIVSVGIISLIRVLVYSGLWNNSSRLSARHPNVYKEVITFCFSVHLDQVLTQKRDDPIHHYLVFFLSRVWHDFHFNLKEPFLSLSLLALKRYLSVFRKELTDVVDFNDLFCFHISEFYNAFLKTMFSSKKSARRLFPSGCPEAATSALLSCGAVRKHNAVNGYHHLVRFLKPVISISLFHQHLIVLDLHQLFLDLLHIAVSHVVLQRLERADPGQVHHQLRGHVLKRNGDESLAAGMR